MQNGPRNELQPISASAPARDIGTITEEIHAIKYQARVVALYVAVELGRRLVEAKELLPHGEWGDWLRDKADIKPSTANNYMRLYEEYGASQLTLFGASVKSQTLENLPMSKALLLLSVPAEEREEFAQDVNAEDLSVRELKATIEQRDMLKKALEMKTQQKKDLETKYHALEQAQIDALNKASEAERLQGLLEQIKEKAEREQAAAERLRIELNKAQKDPTIPKATLDKLKKEAAEAAQKTANEAAKQELEAAKAKAERATAEAIKAKNAASEAERRAAEAENKLKTASPEVAAFKALFDSVQASVQKLRGMIETLRSTDPETADKLSKALHAFGASL